MDPRDKGFKKLTLIHNALRSMKSLLTSIHLSVEQVPLGEVYGRVLGEDIVSPVDVPGFDRAAMDGYAVIAEDTYGASPSNPIKLKVSDTPNLISSPQYRIKLGETLGIVTGAPIPEGSDAVIMVEYTSRRKDIIDIYSSVHPWENVTRWNEDIRKDEVLLRRGDQITPYDQGILKVMGFRVVPVYQRPRVAVASTGDELIDDFNNVKNFKILDTNRIVLSNLIKESGATPIDLGLVRDDLDSLKAQITQGINSADIVIASGGSSVGRYDLLPTALKLLGGKILFHGLAIRPGMPTAVGCLRNCPVFILPGNPVAAVLSFKVIVQPAIDSILGLRRLTPPYIKAKLIRRVVSPPGIRSFIRVKVSRLSNGSVIAEPVRISGSGILSSMVRSNGILEVPESLEGFDEESIVTVELFKPLEEKEHS